MSAPALWVPVLGIHPHVKGKTTGKLLVRGFEDSPTLYFENLTP